MTGNAACQTMSQNRAMPTNPPEVIPFKGNSFNRKANTTRNTTPTQLVGTVFRNRNTGVVIRSNRLPGFQPANTPKTPPSRHPSNRVGTVRIRVHLQLT